MQNNSDKLIISYLNYRLKILVKLRVFPITLCTIVVFAFAMSLSTFAFAEEVTVTPINEEISLQKTTFPIFVPQDNIYPWGVIKGEASSYVERYPVIIQIFQGNDPVQVAQVGLKGDGSFEYKFRLRAIDAESGIPTNFFEGQYTVKIFKVIPNNS